MVSKTVQLKEESLDDRIARLRKEKELLELELELATLRARAKSLPGLKSF